MKGKKLFIAGARGMVGSAIARHALEFGWDELLTPSRQELNLLDQASVFRYIAEEKPDAIVIAAAKVGGIMANSTYPADFIYENLSIAMNLIEGARRAQVTRVLFLGSSCIYPKFCPQPMKEEYLLTSELEPTNEAYAIAKIAGLKLCQHYRTQHGLLYHSAMPTNLYGPGDNYHPENSHVIPGLIRRFHEAKINQAEDITIWGTGTPLREFLHVNDLAKACLLLMESDSPPDWVNIGCGHDLSILALAELIAKVVGYTGTIKTDPSKPDGTPKKLLDVSKIKALGWQPEIALEDGLREAYKDFLTTYENETIRQ